MQFTEIKKGAIISDCGKYRYRLTRIWDELKPKVLFIMLNPSTADADKDDPTIRRCISFARAWGYGGIYVGNIFAYRATDPKVMLEASDPVGPLNREHILAMDMQCSLRVHAWGDSGGFQRDNVAGLTSLWAHLGRNKSGNPKHPLYVKRETKLIHVEYSKDF